MWTYPRSGFRSGGTSECTLVSVFVPGEHPPKPTTPLENHPFVNPPTFNPWKLVSGLQKGPAERGHVKKSQKSSKSVKKLFDTFRQFSRRAKNVKKRQKVSKVFRHFSTLFAGHLFSGPDFQSLEIRVHAKGVVLCERACFLPSKRLLSAFSNSPPSWLRYFWNPYGTPRPTEPQNPPAIKKRNSKNPENPDYPQK